MAQKTHSNRFPGESTRYRSARNRLLTAETDLRRQVERVARMRRKLPLGGPVPEDYVFVKVRTKLSSQNFSGTSWIRCWSTATCSARR